MDMAERKGVHSSRALTIVALLCLVVARAESPPFSGKASVNAVDLLAGANAGVEPRS